VAKLCFLRPILVASLLVVGGLSSVVSVRAQDPDALKQATQEMRTTPAHEPTAAELSKNETVGTALMRTFGSQEYEFRAAAEAMPEDKYNFTPASLNVPGAAFKDVRTFAQLLKHTGAANYFFWSRVTGEKMPENIKGGNGPDELKTKAEIIQFLKDSFAVGHRAAKMITPENALDQVPSFRGTQPRLLVASGAVIHDADEYGQMVEYLRMNGIVPPASRGN